MICRKFIEDPYRELCVACISLQWWLLQKLPYSFRDASALKYNSRAQVQLCIIMVGANE